MTRVVSGAAQPSGRRFHRERSSAHRRALNLSPSTGAIACLRRALSAVRSLWRTAIGLRAVVPESVAQSSGSPTKVYNLTLESENVYYANGVLVANCSDALALAVAGIRPPQRFDFSGATGSRSMGGRSEGSGRQERMRSQEDPLRGLRLGDGDMDRARDGWR